MGEIDNVCVVPSGKVYIGTVRDFHRSLKACRIDHSSAPSFYKISKLIYNLEKRIELCVIYHL